MTSHKINPCIIMCKTSTLCHKMTVFMTSYNICSTRIHCRIKLNHSDIQLFNYFKVKYMNQYQVFAACPHGGSVTSHAVRSGIFPHIHESPKQIKRARWSPIFIRENHQCLLCSTLHIPHCPFYKLPASMTDIKKSFPLYFPFD